jgi:hypothetical protein
VPESTIGYSDPRYYIEGRFYLEGKWQSSRTAVRLEADEGERGSLIVPYTAAEVHVVIQPGGGRSTVDVMQDDLPLDESNKGADVLLGPGKPASIGVEESRSFSVVKNKEFGPHRLQLESGSSGLMIHSISFISAVIPELIQDN